MTETGLTRYVAVVPKRMKLTMEAKLRRKTARVRELGAMLRRVKGRLDVLEKANKDAFYRIENMRLAGRSLSNVCHGLANGQQQGRDATLKCVSTWDFVTLGLRVPTPMEIAMIEVIVEDERKKARERLVSGG